jgi:hypothetical protein
MRLCAYPEWVNVMSARLLVAALLTMHGLGCSGSSPDSQPPQELTRTHAVLAIDQQLSTLTDRDGDMAIMVGVLRVPFTVNSNRLLQLMGLGTELPSFNSCELSDSVHQSSPALSGFDRVELLDVGDISVEGDPRERKLTRQAFPTVSDFISGVLYTTRDRVTEFAATKQVTLRARGGASIPSFAAMVDVVSPPQELTIDNTPVGETLRLSTYVNAEIRWTKGRPGDIVWIELGTNHGKRSMSCAFDDAAGIGTLPSLLAGETGEGKLTFHRISAKPLVAAGLDKAEVRFDVRIAQPVTLY